MSAIHNWKEFNDDWRGGDPAKRFGDWLWRAARVLSWPLRHPHRSVRNIEPWSILFAAFGLFLSLLVFVLDYRDKVEERTVRAWQLVTTKAPGNSGKIDALQYLAKRDGFLCNEADCLITIKTATSLSGIDLSTEGRQAGSYLRGVDLSDANLSEANLSGANLSEADLSDANLQYADLSEADLRGADLRGANLHKAKLNRADISGANLNGAILWSSDPGFAAIVSNDVSSVVMMVLAHIQEACGDEDTQIDGLRMLHIPIPLCSDVPWHEEVHGDFMRRQLR